MNFDYDIIIIHSVDDNVAEEGVGWVSQFSSNLSLFLNEVKGVEPKILTLSEKDQHAIDDYTSAAILIPIISPDFVKCQKCLSFLEMFIESSASDLKSTLSIEKRVFKVNLAPANESELPSKVSENRGFSFYDLDALTTTIRRFVQGSTGNVFTNNYWLTLSDLVSRASNVIDTISLGSDGGGERDTGKTRVVYLAQNRLDLSVEQSIIRRELTSHGYHVMESGHPFSERQIERDIEKADLFIQLIGNEHGEIIPDSDQSLCQMEYDISLKRSTSILQQVETAQFYRIFWMMCDLDDISFVQDKFIKSLTNKKPLAVSVKANNSRKIYLINQKGKEGIESIKTLLESNGFEVNQSNYEGDLFKVLEGHKKNLISCDASLIVYDQENDNWLDTKLKDVLKATGIGRESPISPKVVVSKGSITNAYAEMSDAILIENTNEVTIDSLAPFFKKFKELNE